jgi:hypothetical protein
MQRIFINKYFLFTVGSVCRIKRFTAGSRNVADDDEVEIEGQKWFRQQSNGFYGAGLGTLVKRWGKCISVGGGYVEKYIFFPSSSITYFTFYIHLGPMY